MSRVTNYSILFLRPGAEENPSLVLDVENPELTGHVPRGVDFSSVHVDLSLERGERSETEEKENNLGADIQMTRLND